jgi:hypothetical protein
LAIRKKVPSECFLVTQLAPGKLKAPMQSNGVQFAPEQTLFIKAVPKGRVKFLEDAIISKCGAKAVNSVPDKDPLCHNAYLIYANYTSAGDAKRGQDKLERWLDDKWHFGNRPGYIR